MLTVVIRVITVIACLWLGPFGTALALASGGSVGPRVTTQAQAPAPVAPDISGRWTATIETQVGTFTYTYVFKVEAGKLSGTADNGQGSKSELANGKVDGKTVTFLENLKFMEMEIPVTYTGTIVSADEIKFSRDVGGFATEELVAKRAKP